MNAFSSSRLANGGGRIGVGIPVASAGAKPKAPAAATAPKKSSSSSSQASAAAKAGQKRKRKQDSLFEVEDEDDEDEGVSEEEAVPAPKSRRGAPPPPAAATRRFSHDDEEEEDDDAGDDLFAASDSGNDSSTAPSTRRKKPRQAPEERSSKKQVRAGLEVTTLPVGNPEKRKRDPRFDPMCGEFNPLHFHRHYTWMSSEKSKELDEWKEELRRGRDAAGKPLSEEAREDLRARIRRTQQELQSMQREKTESAIVQEWKSKERKARAEGKGAFYLKKGEVKKLQLAARYINLKEKGGLQKFMVKKTRDVANRDHKYMPHEGRE